MRERRPLSQLVDVAIDKTLATLASDLPYVGMEDIPPHSAIIPAYRYRSDIVGICGQFRAGDILYGKLRPYLRKCAVADRDGVSSTEIIILRPKPEHDERYVAQLVRGDEIFVAVERSTEGTRMPRTSWATLSGIEVFAPRRAEQSAIADVLDAIDAAILDTETLIAKLKLIRTGLVDDLLTRGVGVDGSIRPQSELVDTPLGERPANWSVDPVGAWLNAAEYGVSVSLDDSHGVPVLRMNNILNGEFDLSDMKFAPENAVSHLRLAPGDVLYNRTNSMEHVGKAAIWRSNDAGPAFASYLVRLVPHGHLVSGFLHIWLNWPPVQRALRRFATPGVQQVNINPTNLKRVIMAAPNDPEEQCEIVRRVDQVRLRIESEQRKLVKLSAVRNGLRDDLLSGRVRVSTGKTKAVA